MSKDLSTSTFSLTLTYFWKLTSNRDIAVSFVRDAAAGAIGAPSATMEAMVVCLWHQRFKGPLVFRPNPRRTIRTAHAVADRTVPRRQIHALPDRELGRGRPRPSSRSGRH